MADIQHRVGINAPIEEVFHAVGTREGVASWWTSDVKGASGLGDTLSFYFGHPEPWVAMEIVDLVEPSRVQWRCIEGPDEWKGTTITFEMKSHDEETVLLFTHGGWREQVEFMYHCSTKWGYFLLGLKSGFEGGKATPFPDDAPMSSWG